MCQPWSAGADLNSPGAGSVTSNYLPLPLFLSFLSFYFSLFTPLSIYLSLFLYLCVYVSMCVCAYVYVCLKVCACVCPYDPLLITEEQARLGETNNPPTSFCKLTKAHYYPGDKNRNPPPHPSNKKSIIIFFS